MSIADPVRLRRPKPWREGAYAEAVVAPVGSLTLRDGTGWSAPLDVPRWSAHPDAADEAVARRCSGWVLDIGCGPGRIVEAVGRRGHRVLGIDVCPTAVISTVCRGGSAVSRSVFEPLPDEGRWDTALLMDGNIGIGGNPYRLLRRIRETVQERGLLIVETFREDVDERRRVRIHSGSRAAGPVFPWATVGSPALERHARASGWIPTERWSSGVGGRYFVALRARR
ncbi:class I SAM-dependent methyltransferase [Streptomyces sp. NPDC059819]|uniref:class I SAM-dependent methyltransferase n=1 Tax=Streptomyces sp. NPDC059819 TaxID=3346963 RepID=UPI003660A4B9